MFAQAIQDGVVRGATAGTVRALHKLGILADEAQAFLTKGDFIARCAHDLGVRDALIELGYLEWSWLRLGYRRSDKRLPMDGAFHDLMSRELDKALAARGLTWKQFREIHHRREASRA